MKTKPKFAVIILTNKRPKKQITLKALERSGYTGKVYLLCDTEDPTLKEYKELYGDKVITFNKRKMLGKFDLMTNDVRFNAVVYARNAVYGVAKRLGLDYIVVMDDDYSTFSTVIDKNGLYRPARVTDMNRLIRIHLRFLRDANLDTLAFAQGGDFVGGIDGGINRTDLRPLRKAMNVFFLRVDRPVEFNGIINEDSVMGVQLAATGGLALTNCLVRLDQTTTQQAEGGLTDIYKDVGTYQKSFYTLLASPSSTKIMYQRGVGRVHHFINGECAYPRIVSADLKK